MPDSVLDNVVCTSFQILCAPLFQISDSSRGLSCYPSCSTGALISLSISKRGAGQAEGSLKARQAPLMLIQVWPQLRVYRGDSGWGLSLPLGGNFLRVELRGSSVGWQPPSIDRCPNQPFFATLEPSTVKNRPPITIQLEWWKRWFTVPRRASRKDWALVKR